MRKTLAAILAAALLLAAGGAWAADQRDFVIFNDTGYPIKFIGVNPPGDEVWNENELSHVLQHGQSFKVTFWGFEKGCAWNMKVTWADDNTSAYFRGLNLCQINRVTLKYNRKTDVATYLVD